MELKRKKKLISEREVRLCWKSREHFCSHLCREKTWKAKAHLELKLASIVSDNKKGLFKVC